MAALLAIVLEDTQSHATLARRYLETVGFEVQIYDRLRPMLEAVKLELSPSDRDARPVLVLADCKGIAPQRPDIEGTAALAYIAEEMSRGALRPALLVAISSDPTEDRHAEAASAGCAFFLEKPIDLEKAKLLFQMTLQHPIEVQLDSSGPSRAFHALVRRTIDAALTSTAWVWSSADAYALLERVASFRLQERAKPEGVPRASVEEMIEQLGGYAQTLDRLRTAAAELEYPYTDLLLSYLDHPTWTNEARIAALLMQRSTFHHYRKQIPEQLAIILSR